MNVYLPFTPRLPSAYQEVEYIQSSGTQYINTGYLPTANPKISLDFMYTGGDTNIRVPLYGRRDDQIVGTSSYFCLYLQTSSLYISPNYAGFDPGTSSGVIINRDTKYNITNDKGQIYLDGVLKSSASTTNTLVSVNYPIFLFDNNVAGTRQNRWTIMRLYSCKMFNDGTLVRNFIPCYRKSDNVIGMYDLVNNQFYTNSGTGTFSKGNDVTMAELKNAYIGEAPYEGKELCFTANTANSTVQLTKTGTPTSVTLETSSNGMSWSTYTIGNTITLTNVGDKVYWRNTSETDTGFSIDTGNYYEFRMTGSISGSGDTNYLLNKNSTTTVSSYCYLNLFNGCASLTTTPSLPATTLANNCYMNIFKGCTSLTTPPQLPATTLAMVCYRSMFEGCTGLTTAPSLPVTTLADDCYESMFKGCTNLTTLPKLPATTLTIYCYFCMFQNCSKIKLSTTKTGAYQTAYIIPTTGTGTTESYALYNMFNNTGGTFTGTPSINTTYYTSNTVV